MNTTEPNQMMLVSFFSVYIDNVLSDEIKIYATFSNIKVTKIERSAFLSFFFFGGGGGGWDTRYSIVLSCCVYRILDCSQNKHVRMIIVRMIKHMLDF